MPAKGKLRIIGGKWKRRQIQFPAIVNLRPTPDRVREMLFNWLGQDLTGKTCLDLFAGSGALGFEAASRNARQVALVETNRSASQFLSANTRLLGGSAQISIHNTSAFAFLKKSTNRFDIIFLDPPFKQNAIPEILPRLIESNCLAANCLIYTESSTHQKHLPIPSSWNMIRQSSRGMVSSTLIEVNPESSTE